MRGVYFNENDQYCVAWLRNLIAAGLLPAGDVDDRSIADVQADDLRGYVQHHFFCGIAGWPIALGLAGWPADVGIWTGSCPCQPFSGAGKGEGTADARHLWPAWFRLIDACRPRYLVGEQVAHSSVIGHAVPRARGAAKGAADRVWLDIVRADLETAGYALGAAVLPAAGVGAPHLRHRVYWCAERLADADGHQLDQRQSAEPPADSRTAAGRSQLWLAGRGADGLGLADPGRDGRDQQRGEPGQQGVQGLGRHQPADGRADSRLAVADSERRLEAGADHTARSGDLSGRRSPDVGLADAVREGHGGRGVRGSGQGDSAGDGTARERPAGLCADDGDRLGNPTRGGRRDDRYVRQAADSRTLTGQPAKPSNAADRLGNPGDTRLPDAQPQGLCGPWRGSEGRATEQPGGACGAGGIAERHTAVAGVPDWRDCVWLPCSDGRLRPTSASLLPLAPRISGRVAITRAGGQPKRGETGEEIRWVNAAGTLRASGNAIVPPLAAEFLKAWMDCMP